MFMMRPRSGLRGMALYTLVLFFALQVRVVADDSIAKLDGRKEKPSPGCLQRMSEDFNPMTRSERVAFAMNSMFGPAAFLSAGARAGFNQLDDSPKEWRQGAKGYGRRYGDAYGEFFISQSIEHATSIVLHEDNRYFASGEHGFGRRLKYAIASTFLARHDNGSRVFSFSAIGGAAGSVFISRAWQPRSTTTAGDAAVAFGLEIGARAGLNVAREFLPRFGRFLR